MKVELEVPKEYERLLKGINMKSVIESSLKTALKEELSRAIRVKLALLDLERLAKRSKLTEEKARELSEELKERVARRHGVL
jgi:hypothetical protein